MSCSYRFIHQDFYFKVARTNYLHHIGTTGNLKAKLVALDIYLDKIQRILLLFLLKKKKLGEQYINKKLISGQTEYSHLLNDTVPAKISCVHLL